jgi:hypothetical protein
MTFNKELEEIFDAIEKFRDALLIADTEKYWDEIINVGVTFNTNQEKIDQIYLSACTDAVLNRNSTPSHISYIVATYDDNNIKITIDVSGNHGRPHVHIGIRKDNFHSVSIAIDNGTILNNSGNIPDWKIRKIVEWVLSNEQLIKKIYRCINPWGDTESADKRKNKLPDIDKQ